MLIINMLRAALVVMIGLVNTGLWLVIALTCSQLGYVPSWAAKGWGTSCYWLLHQVAMNVVIKLEIHGDLPHHDQPVVAFSNHPSTPALPGWVYGTNQAFPGRHFAPFARADYRLSPGYKAIGGTIFLREDRDAALEAIREGIKRYSAGVIITIFGDERRFMLNRHAEAWGKVAAERRLGEYGPHDHTLPPKSGGLHAIACALPQAAYFRTSATFNRPTETVWDIWRLPGSVLLVRFDRVEQPPLELSDFRRWLNFHFGKIDQIMDQHLKSGS